MYLITALKGQVADVLYGILKNTTYEETVLEISTLSPFFAAN
jgi:hypothetical protein